MEEQRRGTLILLMEPVYSISISLSLLSNFSPSHMPARSGDKEKAWDKGSNGEGFEEN